LSLIFFGDKQLPLHEGYFVQDLFESIKE